MRPSKKSTGPALAMLCCVLLGCPELAIAQGAPAPAPPSTGTGETVWVTTTQRLKTKVYESPGLTPHPILVVVLHGDSPGSPPTYQYRFAATGAAALSDAVVAAVLRPGYSDGVDRSDGMRGETTGDNYTPEVIDAVATAISELKNRYHPRRVVLVGHSGGSAITADLLGSRQGSLVDAALLVSCPCDLAEWRRHMQSIKGGAIWERPARSLSPIAVVADIPAPVRIWMLVGSDDKITPPALTLAYADALRNRGIAVDVTVAPGLPHDILLEPVALDRLKDVVAAIDPR
jgi:pimeloyl-ACP methyl ester carboxylesterase